ncbi:MAG: dockerin type I repeat-containing protein, partial [Oscillospiraceae bacterium]|nr:dockerin type I repeat-containing protein [Oscillospiraceae bacterium]
LWGDADCSGEVDILDVITLNKAILGKESLTAQGEKNADVNQSGAPDSSDALNIMKLIVRIYTQDDMPLKK